MDSRLSMIEPSRASERSAPGRVIWICLLVVLIMLPTLVFFVARLALPGDGNVAVFDFDDQGGAGLLVQPLVSTLDGVQVGDRLMAIAGHSLELWLGNLWRSAAVESTPGTTAIQELLRRDSQTVELRVPLKPFPLLAALAQRWSMFLFAAYLLGMKIFVFALRPHELGARLFVLLGALVFGNICVFSLGLQSSELRQPWLVSL
jgi:hypothetical protein